MSITLLLDIKEEFSLSLWFIIFFLINCDIVFSFIKLDSFSIFMLIPNIFFCIFFSIVFILDKLSNLYILVPNVLKGKIELFCFLKFRKSLVLFFVKSENSSNLSIFLSLFSFWSVLLSELFLSFNNILEWLLWKSEILLKIEFLLWFEFISKFSWFNFFFVLCSFFNFIIEKNNWNC